MLFTDLPNMQHVATARNRFIGEERLYRTPDGAWIMRQENFPEEELSESDVIDWLETRHEILVSRVNVERNDDILELIEAGYLKTV